MKKFFIVLLSLALLVSMVSSSFAAIINGSFECGLDGWSIDIAGERYWSLPGGIAAEPPPPLDYDELNKYAPTIGAIALDKYRMFSPIEGKNFLIIQAGNFDTAFVDYIHTDGTEYTYSPWNETYTLNQYIYLSKGEIISGYSAFITSDYLDNDMGWVGISDGKYTSKIWEKSAGDVYDEDLGEGFSDWECWRWKAPKNGQYTLSLNQYGDDQLESWSLYDNIQIQPAPIPEPDTILLLGAGLIGIVWPRRKLNK